LLSRYACKTLTALELDGDVSTENVIELHGRPADPEDVVRSRVQDPQPLIVEGAFGDTTGAVGLVAVTTCTICAGVVGHVPHHVVFLLLHCALILPGKRENSLPTDTMRLAESPEYHG
jgi:hypothetical protein